MKKTLLLATALFLAIALSGCANKSNQQLQEKNMGQTSPNKSEATAPKAETAQPNTANDLPTAIDETEKDLQVIDNDLKELESLDMDEGNVEL